MSTDLSAFQATLSDLPDGYFRAMYCGATWGVTIERLSDGRQIKLYGEDLGGRDHVSFNLYLTRSGKVLLKPCEMPDQKVIDFVLGAVPN